MSLGKLTILRSETPEVVSICELCKMRFCGVTPGIQAGYNGNRSLALTHHANNASGESFGSKPGVAMRAAWSSAGNHPGKSRLSTRAESRLAPCMVRPNLFSGD